jgi:hypothetical protein
MAFSHGTGARFYYSGVDFSDYLDEVDPALKRTMSEFAPLSAGWKQALPGLRFCTVSLAGLYDGAAGAMEEAAWSALDGGTERPFAYLPQGDARGGIAYCGETVLGDEKITAGDDVVRMPVSVIGSDRTDRCVILHPLSEERSSGSEASVDGGAGAPASYGLEAYLLCTALTSTDTLEVAIEASDDDGVSDPYTPVAAFEQLSAKGGERKTVGAGPNAIKRYVRAAWTLINNSGTPSATFFVAYARKTH